LVSAHASSIRPRRRDRAQTWRAASGGGSRTVLRARDPVPCHRTDTRRSGGVQGCERSTRPPWIIASREDAP
jgi:hypothetical protein